MKSEELEVARGSGNVFRDLGQENADVRQLKAILAAEIIKALDRDGLSVRGAHSRTGIAAADFSRIRNADLGRFTVDRLMSIINRLGSRVEVRVRLRRAETVPHVATASTSRSPDSALEKISGALLHGQIETVPAGDRQAGGAKAGVHRLGYPPG